MQDFVEVVEGAARRYCEALQRDGLSPSMTYLAHDRKGKLYRRTERPKPSTPLAATTRQPETDGTSVSAITSSGSSSQNIPMQHFSDSSNQNSGPASTTFGSSASSTRLSQSDNSTHGIPGLGTAQTSGQSTSKDKYLLLCGNTKSNVLDVRQEDLKQVTCDQSLTNLLRIVFLKITQLRGDVKEFLSFRKLQAIKAVQFELLYGDVGRITMFDSVPPVDNKEYSHEPTGLFPPVDGVYLLHCKLLLFLWFY